MSHRHGKGDKVRFAKSKIGVYAQIYGITKDDLFEVALVERRGSKRILYLRSDKRESWLPVYPNAVNLVQKRKEPETT